MEKVALDTDVLIDFLRGVEEAVSLVRNLRERTFICTTVINAFELYWGAYKLRRVDVIDKLLGRIGLLELGPNEARVAGEEIAYLESIGQPLDVRDVLIGTIAKVNGCALATGNIRHFKRIRGLGVIEYVRERWH